MSATTPEEDLERAADGDRDALARLDARAQATVIADRRLAGLLAIALDEGAAALAASRVGAALVATSPSARQRSIRRVRRRIRGQPRLSPALMAAAAVVALVCLGSWWGLARDSALARSPDLIGSPDGGSSSAGRDHTLADGSRIIPAGHAVWRASATANGLGVHLERGVITVKAEPQAPGRRLTVTTANARIAVVGTEFTVAAQPGTTEIAVAHGTVEIAAAHERLEITAGGTATAREGAWPALVPMHLTHEVSVVRDFVPTDGVPPRYWHTAVGPCPPGRVGEALHGVDYSEVFKVFGVAYDNYVDPVDTIRIATGMRFQGWLWCDGPLTDLKVQICDGDRDMDFWLPLQVPRRTWVGLDIPLALLADDAGRHPEPGNRIADLHVYSTRASGQTLVLADARLVIPAARTP